MDEGKNTEIGKVSEDQKLYEERKRLFQKSHGLDQWQWLTIKRYAEKYQITPQVVEDWILSGVIPANCVDVIPVKEAIRIIIDQPYI
ncbi:hypothetical protein [Larkinella rosea]|uniref:Uncharacterized protein n=1 Tax=Larkinella rosea TaxID=2025312 RepID=A0A3P1BDK6_9BACT|nr:hypothetical protein [Larkinella rosea]RRA99217.1 hypothetical protein EHT25_30125 [Larkinella rosea]